MHWKAPLTNGTPVLLEALSCLGETASPVETIVFEFVQGGSGTDLSVVKARIAELGIDDRVTLRAPVTHHEMPALLAGCHVGLVAYGRDLGGGTMLNRLFEYMAAGLAILAPSYSPEVRAIIDDEDIGLTVDFEDPREVAAAMTWFTEHPDEARRMGERARSSFLERHHWDAEFDKLMAAMDGPTGTTAP